MTCPYSLSHINLCSVIFLLLELFIKVVPSHLSEIFSILFKDGKNDDLTQESSLKCQRLTTLNNICLDKNLRFIALPCSDGSLDRMQTSKPKHYMLSRGEMHFIFI